MFSKLSSTLQSYRQFFINMATLLLAGNKYLTRKWCWFWKQVEPVEREKEPRKHGIVFVLSGTDAASSTRITKTSAHRCENSKFNLQLNTVGYRNKVRKQRVQCHKLHLQSIFHTKYEGFFINLFPKVSIWTTSPTSSETKIEILTAYTKQFQAQ
jgi:hypothetical protein